jgi:NTP pyrophosphatase (non-canonical NTP hydrolase)
MNTFGQDVARISRWMDESKSYEGIDSEAHLWRRCMKISEETGEVFEALSGTLGENPRKGVTHSMDDVVDELLDVAMAALGAVEHITGNEGWSEQMLFDKAKKIKGRVGLE